MSVMLAAFLLEQFQPKPLEQFPPLKRNHCFYFRSAINPQTSCAIKAHLIAINAQSPNSTKIYRKYVYFVTTCVNHVANFSFGISAWCICPCVHNHPDRVVKSDGPLSRHFQRVYVCIFSKSLLKGPFIFCYLPLALYNLAQHFSKFTLTCTCLMSWFKFVIFCFLPLCRVCIQAIVIMLILRQGSWPDHCLLDLIYTIHTEISNCKWKW